MTNQYAQTRSRGAKLEDPTAYNRFCASAQTQARKEVGTFNRRYYGSFVTTTRDLGSRQPSVCRLSSKMRIDLNDLDAIERLGSGAYGSVYRARISNPDVLSARIVDGNGDNTNANNSKDSHKEYAVKCINSQQTAKSPDHATVATVDLAMEGAILSKLRHPNIVKYYGHGTLFLIMEILQKQTLEDRIKQQDQSQLPYSHSGNANRDDRPGASLISSIKPKANNKSKTKNKSKTIGIGGGGLLGRNQNHRKPLNLQLYKQDALGIAQAMDYLHSKQFVFGDLKPSNIGYDQHTGAVKLFDFGMARRVQQKRNVVVPDKVAPAKQTNTQSTPQHLEKTESLNICGTMRYMAPEVMTGSQGVSYASDVYTFALVLWEICHGEKPFGQYRTPAMLRQAVEKDQVRPKCHSDLPFCIRTLLQDCWQHDPDLRPNFVEIERRIRKSVEECHDWEKSSPKPSPGKLLRRIFGRDSSDQIKVDSVMLS